MNTCRMTGSTSFVRSRQAAVVGRHVAPAEQDLAFARDRALDLLLAGHPRRRLLRQEHHADAVLADRRQRDALRCRRPAQERVGQLDQDAGAVALQRVGAGRAAVREVLEDRRALRDDRVALLALDVGDEAQAARVVLVRGVVQTLARRRLIPRSLGTFLHDDLTAAKMASGRRESRRRPRLSRYSGRNLFRLAAMLQCGKAPRTRQWRGGATASARRPIRPSKRLAPGAFLGFNLNKMG